MTLKTIWREIVRFCKPLPKRRHVVYASRSKLTLNATELRYCEAWVDAIDRDIPEHKIPQAIAAEVGISRHTARDWARKPKIRTGISHWQATHDIKPDLRTASQSFSGDLKDAVGLRILPADNIFEAENGPRCRGEGEQ